MASGRHDATGRSTHVPASSRVRKANRPPEDQPWVWITREMMESPAWRAMSENARRLLDRVMLEHMAHAGTENGNLPVTYDDLGRWGIRRNSVAPVIAEAVALGWLLHQRGQASHVAGKGHPQRFGLAWLPTSDGEPAVDGWRRITTTAQAKATAAAARAAGAASLKPTPPPKI